MVSVQSCGLKKQSQSYPMTLKNGFTVLQKITLEYPLDNSSLMDRDSFKAIVDVKCWQMDGQKNRDSFEMDIFIAAYQAGAT